MPNVLSDGRFVVDLTWPHGFANPWEVNEIHNSDNGVTQYSAAAVSKDHSAALHLVCVTGGRVPHHSFPRISLRQVKDSMLVTSTLYYIAYPDTVAKPVRVRTSQNGIVSFEVADEELEFMNDMIRSDSLVIRYSENQDLQFNQSGLARAVNQMTRRCR